MNCRFKYELQKCKTLMENTGKPKWLVIGEEFLDMAVKTQSINIKHDNLDKIKECFFFYERFCWGWK